MADIPETQDPEDENCQDSIDFAIDQFQKTTDEIAALKLALGECWTLCNTLAGLSYIHRGRTFAAVKKRNGREQAWKSCWKLCQKLYETRDEDTSLHVRATLDLCRDFCQTLFEVRQREHDIADSVLRVSFELNNHLFNTHDRTLPEAFRERTLDFYVTLCHRLMKQRTHFGEETDALLRACWSLAEMLFTLRQNKREGKQADEELLGSAVQACWELCDLFREGWTQVRPERLIPTLNGEPRLAKPPLPKHFSKPNRLSWLLTFQWQSQMSRMMTLGDRIQRPQRLSSKTLSRFHRTKHKFQISWFWGQTQAIDFRVPSGLHPRALCPTIRITQHLLLAPSSIRQRTPDLPV